MNPYMRAAEYAMRDSGKHKLIAVLHRMHTSDAAVRELKISEHLEIADHMELLAECALACAKAAQIEAAARAGNMHYRTEGIA